MVAIESHHFMMQYSSPLTTRKYKSYRCHSVAPVWARHQICALIEISAGNAVIDRMAAVIVQRIDLEMDARKFFM